MRLLLISAGDPLAKAHAGALGAAHDVESVEVAEAPPLTQAVRSYAAQLASVRGARDPSALLERLHREGGSFDLVLFYGYALPETAFGLPLVPERAILVPLASDEPRLRLAPYRLAFHAPTAIGYRDDGERALVQRVFGNRRVPSAIVGDDPAPVLALARA